MTLDVLHDHDGVVHHDADREHQAEEGERVDGEPESEEHREGADDGDRHRDERNEGGAPGLEEQDHHQHDERNRLEERMQHRIDRLLHELRGVVKDPVIHSLGEVLLELLHGLADASGELERVRAG